MPHFLRAGRRNFRPEKLSAFQLFGRNYDFGFIFAQKTGFMPQLRLIYRRNPPLNFVRAVSTLRLLKCFLMICMVLSKKTFLSLFQYNGQWLRGLVERCRAEGQNLADAVLKTASSSLFVIQ